MLSHSWLYGPCSAPILFLRPLCGMPKADSVHGQSTWQLCVSHADRGKSALHCVGLSFRRHPLSGFCPTSKYPCSVQPLSNYPCSAQPQRIPAMPNHRVSLQCPTAGYPSSAQPVSTPAVPNQVSLQCPITARFPCSDQQLLRSIPAAPNSRVSLHCTDKPHGIPAMPMARHPCSVPKQYLCSAQWQGVLVVPSPCPCRTPQHLPLQCQTAIFLQCICSAARKTVEGEGETLHFLCNNGFRVGMLEIHVVLFLL